MANPRHMKTYLNGKVLNIIQRKFLFFLFKYALELSGLSGANFLSHSKVMNEQPPKVNWGQMVKQ